MLHDPGVVSIAHRALGAGACAALMLKLEAMLLDDRLHLDVNVVGQQLVAVAPLVVVGGRAHVYHCARTGASVFDLSVSGRSLAASEGPGPLFRKQKQGAAGAIFEDKPPLNKQISMHFGHQSISATIQPPHQPNPTDPSRRPLDRPTDPHNSTLGAPWVPLGTRPDGPWGPGPPSGPLFFCFCFFSLTRSL